MAVSPFKTFVSGEVLTASDLNASFTQLTDNGEDLAWPASKAKDFNGQELILDSDSDTSIRANTDDQIDFKVGGNDLLKLVAGTATLSTAQIPPQYATIAAALADTLAIVGNSFTVTDYVAGNKSSVLFFKWVAPLTGTVDGGSYLDHDTLALQAEQNLPAVLTPLMWGAVADGTTDDRAAIQASVNFAATTSATAFESGAPRIVSLAGRAYGVGSPGIQYDGLSNVSLVHGILNAVGAWTATDFVVDLEHTGTYKDCSNNLFHNINIDCKDLCSAIFLQNTFKISLDYLYLVRYDTYGVRTSLGSTALNGGLLLNQLTTTQARDDDTWSGNAIELGGGITNGRGIGLSIRSADFIMTGCNSHLNRICCEIDKANNAQMIGNHFFSGFRTTNNNGFTITNCADNGSGLIRVTTSASHLMETDEVVEIDSVVGTTEANRWWKVTTIDATNVDLQASTFTNAYISGGAIIPYNYSLMVGANVRPVSGLHMVGNYFDATPAVIFGAFLNNFTGNMVTAAASRFIMVSENVDEDASGFVCVGNRFRVVPELVRTGSGTWSKALDVSYMGNQLTAGGTAELDSHDYIQGSVGISGTSTVLTVGSVEAITTLNSASPGIHAVGTAGKGSIGALRASVDTLPARVIGTKSRATTVGGTGAVLSGDDLFEITAIGNNGTDNTQRAASIVADARANFATSVQGGWRFQTRDSGDSVPVDRWEILAGGNLVPATDLANSVGSATKRVTDVVTNKVSLVDGITAPATVSGHAQIFVDTADGDLKIKFGDGTVKTIVVDT